MSIKVRAGILLDQSREPSPIDRDECEAAYNRAENPGTFPRKRPVAAAAR